jgi:hypothetical protein
MLRLLFCALQGGHAFSTITADITPVTHNKLPTIQVYGEPFIGDFHSVNAVLPGSYPRPAPGERSSFAWPEVAVLGVAGAMLAGAIGKARGEATNTSVAEPDLESARIATRIATLALGGQTDAEADDVPFVTRRDALFAGAAGMIACVPFAAYADDAPADAPASDAPAAAPAAPPRKPSMFGAPPRKADESKIGVSRLKIPKEGYGSPADDRPSVKLYTSFQGKTAVIGPNGAEGGSPKGFFDGGENKEKSDFGKPGKQKYGS